MLKGWATILIASAAIASAPVSGTVGAESLETDTAVMIETEREEPSGSIEMEEIEEEIDLDDLALTE